MPEFAADTNIEGAGPFSFLPRPITVEAIRWIGTNGAEIAEWAGNLVHIEHARPPRGRSVPVLQLYRGRGVETIPIGHWIARDPVGALHSYDPHTFDVHYARSGADDDNHRDRTAGTR
ncbi:hypothetical protein OG874_21660 [Nocardia sp. NBC_00565]|uniref:hypothetical protein n=1 Tax=Nocardia sp. NBC_00565 TaxID=2975993 RepID=UPI002E81482A|nr:hypothetical protein [Nocardia sp. NBC_00565]WUC07532.1 hypothetical protein OG874_21660 [Nocardia sp. NBC_00565]